MKRCNFEALLEQYERRLKRNLIFLVLFCVLFVALFVTGVLISNYENKVWIMIIFSLLIAVLTFFITMTSIFGIYEYRQKKKQLYAILGSYLVEVNGIVKEIGDTFTSTNGRRGQEITIKQEERDSVVYYDLECGEIPFHIDDHVHLKTSESFIVEYEVDNG